MRHLLRYYLPSQVSVKAGAAQSPLSGAFFGRPSGIGRTRRCKRVASWIKGDRFIFLAIHPHSEFNTDSSLVTLSALATLRRFPLLHVESSFSEIRDSSV